MPGAQIGRKTVQSMVGAYRAKRAASPRHLKFVTYSVTEILRLLRDNRIITPDAYDQCLKSPDLDSKGFKFYMGTHTGIDDCPVNSRTGERKSNYIGLDTIIVCNTALVDGVWQDLLSDKETFAAIADTDLPLDGDPGSALEQGGLCPPDCDTDDEGNGQVDIFP